MPDSVKASADLKTFAKQNVGQLYRELKVLLDPQTDLKNFIKNEARVFTSCLRTSQGSVADSDANSRCRNRKICSAAWRR